MTVSLLKEKIIKKIGYLEVYVRKEAGTEAAIHSTNEMYNKKKKQIQFYFLMQKCL